MPAIWSLEIANAMLVGERKKRLRQPEILRFTVLLDSLPVTEDIGSPSAHVRNVLPLAREYGLSAYDAAYLELAIRHGAALATLDERLAAASRRAGVEIFEGAGRSSADKGQYT